MNEFIFNLPSNELMNYILATIVQAFLKIDIGRFWIFKEILFISILLFKWRKNYQS